MAKVRTKFSLLAGENSCVLMRLTTLSLFLEGIL